MPDFYTVSNINLYIKSILSRDIALSKITIKGEVSGCKYHSSGHIYFTLKDNMSQLSCVMFAGKRTTGLDFKLNDGAEVLVTGSIQVYERDGRYQLYADKIKQDGIGLLYERFEALKRKLEQEGLFDASHKKKIPEHPKRIGIVTSRTGAAIHDIITVSKRRNPYVQLILYPASVQGAGAADTIVRGLCELDKYGLDCIIVGRGGGSIEDLMPFNEEIVARAIFACNTPIISAVGHEIDFTISDYVADLRAATPSAAAELAVYDINLYFRMLDDYRHELTYCMDRQLNSYKNQLDKFNLRLQNLSPQKRLTQKCDTINNYYDKIKSLIHSRIDSRHHELDILIEKLNGLSPLNKLKKGYAYVTLEDGKSVNSVKNLSCGQALNISMTDGSVLAHIQEINNSDSID